MTPWLAWTAALGLGVAAQASLQGPPAGAASESSASRSPAECRERSPGPSSAQSRAEPILQGLRSVLRPMSMPAAWIWLDRSSRRGWTEEELAATRALLAVVPEWTDGHVHAAWLVGLDQRRGIRDPELRADLCVTAIEGLERAAREAEGRGDLGSAVTLLLSGATLLLHASDMDSELGPSYLDRTGLDLREHARNLAERAVAEDSDEISRGRLADTYTASLRAALELGDIERAEALRTGAIDLFASIDAPSARRLETSLTELGPLADAATDPERVKGLAERAPWLASTIDLLLRARDSGSGSSGAGNSPARDGRAPRGGR